MGLSIAVSKSLLGHGMRHPESLCGTDGQRLPASARYKKPWRTIEDYSMSCFKGHEKLQFVVQVVKKVLRQQLRPCSLILHHWELLIRCNRIFNDIITYKWMATKCITLNIRRYVGNCFSVYTVTAHLFWHKYSKDLNTEYLEENLRILLRNTV